MKAVSLIDWTRETARGVASNANQSAGHLVLMSGTFLLSEPTRVDGEDLADYLERFQQTNHRTWNFLSEPNWGQIRVLVSTCDLPESISGWFDIGATADFTYGHPMFTDPTDLYRFFRFDV